ncbi:MAG: ABC transporter permease, partial [Candidatus Moraniibacteriota bacterium]
MGLDHKTIFRFGIRSPHEWAIVFRLAFRNLRMNKIRTALTVIGIVIGIMSVIIVMAGGTGLKNYVLGQVDVFGTDYIQVEVKVPGVSEMSSENISGRGTGLAITTLKEKDAEAVAKIPNVRTRSAGNMDQELVSYNSVNKRVMIFGVNSSYVEIDRQIQPVEGAFFSEGDEAGAAQVAVIGAGVKKSFFGEGDAAGKNIKIKDQNYRVVGVLKERGSAGFFNFDDVVYVPFKTLNKKLLGIDYAQFITFKVKDTARMEETAVDIRETMRREHDITDPAKDDFVVMSAAEGKDMIEKVFGTINYLLLALTSISLLVGGVGIMNVMYVAVTERTHEIGLRKALGATNSGILRQFLFEAVIVTFLGGAVGILFGVISTYLLNNFLIRLGYMLQFSVPAKSIITAVGFSVFTGLIFGIYPAWKAS